MTTSEIWTVELDPATVGGKSGVTCIVKARDAREAFRIAAKQHGAGEHKPVGPGDLRPRAGLKSVVNPEPADAEPEPEPTSTFAPRDVLEPEELTAASIERATMRAIFAVLDVLMIATGVAAVVSGVVLGIAIANDAPPSLGTLAFLVTWVLTYVWLRPSRFKRS